MFPLLKHRNFWTFSEKFIVLLGICKLVVTSYIRSYKLQVTTTSYNNFKLVVTSYITSWLVGYLKVSLKICPVMIKTTKPSERVENSA